MPRGFENIRFCWVGTGCPDLPICSTALDGAIVIAIIANTGNNGRTLISHQPK